MLLHVCGKPHVHHLEQYTVQGQSECKCGSNEHSNLILASSRPSEEGKYDLCSR